MSRKAKKTRESQGMRAAQGATRKEELRRWDELLDTAARTLQAAARPSPPVTARLAHPHAGARPSSSHTLAISPQSRSDAPRRLVERLQSEGGSGTALLEIILRTENRRAALKKKQEEHKKEEEKLQKELDTLKKKKEAQKKMLEDALRAEAAAKAAEAENDGLEGASPIQTPRW